MAASKGRGRKSAVNPKIQKILKMFDPTIFHTARSACPRFAAIIEVASSGREVPMATIVRPMNASESLAIRAISMAHSTKIFPPRNKPTNPPTI
jgi:hypothetical protein